MAEFILMPTLGFDMEEGTMGTWLKNVGEPVSKGDILAEIESDKVTQELQARADGILLAQLAQTGDMVPVGAHLGVIGDKDEDISSMMAETESGPPATSAEPEPEPVVSTAAVSAETAKPQTAAPAAPSVSSEFPGGVKATPVARRVAAEHDVDLKQINGSGPDGRIRKQDVEAFIAQPPPVAVPAVSIPAVTGDDVTEIELTRMRQVIARRTTESATTTPHFYVTSDIDMAAALALRKQINDALTPEEKVTVNDLVVKAAALALRQFPNLNASFAGDRIIHHHPINVGSAVAIEGGLLNVVQKNTDSSSISKIARDHKEMIGRVHEGRVRPEDVDGATFTVSNLGAYDVEHFTAIINPPHAAILAIGTAKQVPVVVDGELTVGTRMKATISADHRVTDGAEAARYMQAFKAILEEPLKLLL